MTPHQLPEHEVIGAPSTPPRGRTALAFVLAAVFLLAMALGYRAMGQRSGKRDNALAQCLRAEYFAQQGVPDLWSDPHAGTTPWRDAEKQYRAVLKTSPRLARARRGLAAVLWLRGRRLAAANVMRGGADVPASRRDVWLATQAAFGAVPRPTDAAELRRYQEALRGHDLGWSRFVAREALAANKREALRARNDLHDSGSAAGKRMVAPALFFAFSFIVGFLILTFSTSAWKLNGLAPLAVPPVTLGAACVAGLLAQSGPAVLIRLGVRQLAERGADGLYYAAILAVHTCGALAALAVGSVLLRGHGASVKSLGWAWRGALVWGVGGYLAQLPVLVVVSRISQAVAERFPGVETPVNSASWMVSSAHGWGLVAVFAAVCIVGPFVEELLFRGFLFRALERPFGFWGGAVLSSAVFASLHPQLPLGFLPIMVIGVALCVVYRGSGSLTASWLCHALNNAVTMAFTLVTYGSARWG